MRPMHRSPGKAHVQWLKTHCQWYSMEDVRTHNSRTDSHRIFKLAGLNFSGNAGELSSLTFFTAGTQFPLKWTFHRERRVPNSSDRISGVW